MNSRADRQVKAELAWHGLSRRIATSDPSLRLMVLAAHPDDEAIGASSLLSRFPLSFVVFLTDGATRDPRFWTGGPYDSRQHYAWTRRKEAVRALAVAGIPKEQIGWLGGVDQESIFEIQTLSERFEAILMRHAPDAVITHAFEGGHPDHDAAALMARLAISLLPAEKPEVIEMTSYHARNGKCVTGELLDGEKSADPNLHAADDMVLELSAEDRRRKRQMFEAYASQRLVLGSFSVDRELLRAAPEYDFSKPPHQGKLWYECMQWPMTGERWRELAAPALEHVEEPSC